jgi:hypothetical protein
MNGSDASYTYTMTALNNDLCENIKERHGTHLKTWIDGEHTCSIVGLDSEA